MNSDRKWVVVRIDGKIAAISTDYRMLAEISARIAQMKTAGKGTGQKRGAVPYNEITAHTTGFDEIWRMRKEIRWEDMLLSGTDFQKKVWRKLWEITHPESSEDGHGHPAGTQGSEAADEGKPRLICYTDFAELCSNRAGVRAVAHAIGLNPVSVIIPCHLVIPKETIDRITAIRKKAENTIFKGDDLCITSILTDPATDFGEYSLGKDLKRRLIIHEFTGE